MKQVTIIFRTEENTKVLNFIRSNLEEVFGQYVNFTDCFLCNLTPGTKLRADAFLAQDEDIFHEVEDFVDDFSKIIKINRSPGREALNTLSLIPPGTTVLIVNDSYKSALDTTNSFYEAGVSHINMMPFDQALEASGVYDRIDTAVTLAEPHLVPAHIKKVYDIGYRKVSFDTMFNLMKLLDLDVIAVNRNLFRHIHSIVESTEAFHSNYIYSYLKGQMLSHVINTSSVGMVLVDSRYDMVYLNEKAHRILQSDGKNSIKISDYIDPKILTSADEPDVPVKILGKNYYYKKYPITLMDEITGYYITLQEESEIEPANKSSRQKGFTAKYQFKDIVHVSESMNQVIATAGQIALTNHTVLIRGESGTGKELIAQSIHNASPRSKYPFVAVNCAALPDTLLESELFGYEAGAFTGAQNKSKIGLFEAADHGTIFLDEIGDISPKLQSRLLRTIQEHQIMRLGSDRLIGVDFRLIAATNKNLEDAVQNGKFRSDLFFRLNVLPVHLPPLRSRKEDIEPLLQHFLGSEYPRITPSERAALKQYDWPGNIRELKNVVTYYETLFTLPEYILPQGEGEKEDSSISNAASKILEIINQNTAISHGIGRSTLLHMLKTEGLDVSDGRLRHILGQMEENGLIHIGKGRYGNRITEKGLSYLKKHTF